MYGGTVMATLGERIRAARISAGLSQEELAAAAGVRRQAVNKWEGDTAVPDTANLAKAAKALDVTVTALTTDSPQTRAPYDAPSLKGWVGRQLSAVNQGLNEYLEDIIENEVRRRILAMDDETIARLRREALADQLNAEAEREVQRVATDGTKTHLEPQD